MKDIQNIVMERLNCAEKEAAILCDNLKKLIQRSFLFCADGSIQAMERMRPYITVIRLTLCAAIMA